MLEYLSDVAFSVFLDFHFGAVKYENPVSYVYVAVNGLFIWIPLN
jgi:hypothetical protein